MGLSAAGRRRPLWYRAARGEWSILGPQGGDQLVGRFQPEEPALAAGIEVFVTSCGDRRPTKRGPLRKSASIDWHGLLVAVADCHLAYSSFPCQGEKDATTRPEPTRVHQVGCGRHGRPRRRFERSPSRRRAAQNEGPQETAPPSGAAHLPWFD